jgi:hypothetical protein
MNLLEGLVMARDPKKMPSEENAVGLLEWQVLRPCSYDWDFHTICVWWDFVRSGVWSTVEGLAGLRIRIVRNRDV